jgi:hypothetical protein
VVSLADVATGVGCEPIQADFFAFKCNDSC